MSRNSTASLAYAIEKAIDQPRSPIAYSAMARVLLKVLDGREVLFAPGSNADDLFTAIRLADNAYRKLAAVETSTFSWQVFLPIITGIASVAELAPEDRSLIHDVCEAVATKCGHPLNWGNATNENRRMNEIFAALETHDTDALIEAIRKLCP